MKNKIICFVRHVLKILIDMLIFMFVVNAVFLLLSAVISVLMKNPVLPIISDFLLLPIRFFPFYLLVTAVVAFFGGILWPMFKDEEIYIGQKRRLLFAFVKILVRTILFSVSLFLAVITIVKTEDSTKPFALISFALLWLIVLSMYLSFRREQSDKEYESLLSSMESKPYILHINSEHFSLISLAFGFKNWICKFAPAVTDKLDGLYDYGNGYIQSFSGYEAYYSLHKRERKPEKLIITTSFLSICNISFHDITAILSCIDQMTAQGCPVMVVYKKSLLEKTLKRNDYFFNELIKRKIVFVFDVKSEADKIRNFLNSKTGVSDSEKNSIMEMRQYIANLEKTPKYDFVRSSILSLSSVGDNAEKFYTLINMTEYIFHYRALYQCINNGYFDKRENFVSSMGKWNDMQKTGLSYVSDEIRDAYNLIGSVLKHEATNKKKIEYYEICNRMTELRNRYIGHGTMAFSVDDNLLGAVMELAMLIVGVFAVDGCDIALDDTAMKIDQNIRIVTTMPLFIKESGKTGLGYSNVEGLFLLSAIEYADETNCEYLNYDSGAVIALNKQDQYRLDYMGE